MVHRSDAFTPPWCGAVTSITGVAGLFFLPDRPDRDVEQSRKFEQVPEVGTQCHGAALDGARGAGPGSL